ncbi:MAG: CTB family bacteriocin [Oculatellaceae cyanobacterium Prado106]|nr:CTB family bacteriocin [Oculatellaceae cyanobacterium Prado106]
MSYEINPQVAIELSEQELDTVAGGLDLSNFKGLLSSETTGFKQRNIGAMTQTSSGPNGSTTGSVSFVEEIETFADQFLALG